MTELAEQECPKEPMIPSIEVCRLRAKLILEEALETIEALGFDTSAIYQALIDISYEFSIKLKEPNLIDIADGLADLHYVGYCGTALACGIDMERVFNKVHQNNMSKLWTTQELKEFNSMYPDNLNASSPIGSVTGDRIWRVKDTFGKLIKSPSHTKVSITLEDMK